MATYRKNYPGIVYFEDLTSAATSPSYWNGNIYENLTLEISGTATACEVIVEGCIKATKEDGEVLPESGCQWTEFAALSATSFEVVSPIPSKGIYVISISGCAAFRIRVNSVTGGNINITGTLK